MYYFKYVLVIMYESILVETRRDNDNRPVVTETTTTTADTKRGSNLKDLLASHQLLGDHACNAKHGKAAVLELLGAHGVEGIGISGLEAEGIEAQVTVDVVLLQVGHGGLGVAGVGLVGSLPASDDRLALNQGDEEQHELPEVAVDVVSLLELVDGGAGDLAIEEGVHELTHDEPEGGDHGHTAVLELGLADLLDVSGGLAVGQADGIWTGRMHHKGHRLVAMRSKRAVNINKHEQIVSRVLTEEPHRGKSTGKAFGGHADGGSGSVQQEIRMGEGRSLVMTRIWMDLMS